MKHLFYLFILLFQGCCTHPYGGSQARGLIGAVAAGLHHSSQQCRILNPLSKARHQTQNLMVPSQIPSAAPQPELQNEIFKSCLKLAKLLPFHNLKIFKGTLLCVEQVTGKDLLCSKGKSTQYFAIIYMGKKNGDIYSLCCIPETNTTL